MPGLVNRGCRAERGNSFSVSGHEKQQYSEVYNTLSTHPITQERPNSDRKTALCHLWNSIACKVKSIASTYYLRSLQRSLLIRLREKSCVVFHFTRTSAMLNTVALTETPFTQARIQIGTDPNWYGSKLVRI